MMEGHMLEAKDFARIRNWMLRNARPLELARWRFLFEKGTREDVQEALAAYQNPDGGFGHALEADAWNPASSPLQTWTACTILAEVRASTDAPVVQSALRYLEQTPDFVDGIWRSTVPSNNQHPHAPWWHYNDDCSSRAEWGYNPSAALAGYILMWSPEDRPVFRQAVEVAHDAIADARQKGVSGIRPLTHCQRTLLRGIEELPLLTRERVFPGWEIFGDLVRQNTTASIDRDPSRWFVSYATLPTDLIESPSDPQFEDEREGIEAALDGFLSCRNEAGVWDISWTWDLYPEAFAVSRHWWQGVMALERVKLLHTFGRIEGEIQDKAPVRSGR
jgi:hypothetical protein